jgi:hypothetical protein
MWITTLDNEWYIYEIRGVSFVSWVSKDEKEHACVFKKHNADFWLEILMQLTKKELKLVKI